MLAQQSENGEWQNSAGCAQHASVAARLRPRSEQGAGRQRVRQTQVSRPRISATIGRTRWWWPNWGQRSANWEVEKCERGDEQRQGLTSSQVSQCWQSNRCVAPALRGHKWSNIHILGTLHGPRSRYLFHNKRAWPVFCLAPDVFVHIFRCNSISKKFPLWVRQRHFQIISEIWESYPENQTVFLIKITRVHGRAEFGYSEKSLTSVQSWELVHMNWTPTMLPPHIQKNSHPSSLWLVTFLTTLTLRAL